MLARARDLRARRISRCGNKRESAALKNYIANRISDKFGIALLPPSLVCGPVTGRCCRSTEYVLHFTFFVLCAVLLPSIIPKLSPQKHAASLGIVHLPMP